MEYIYPALFHENSDNSFTVTYPDLPGCISEGKSLGNAIEMAQAALSEWLEYCNDKKREIPRPSNIKDIRTSDNEFASIIRISIRDGRAVKRTVSLPKWMDDKVSETGLSLSRVLQDALLEKIAQ